MHQNSISAIAHNESHVCDVALSPTRAKGHVAERRAAAPRSPRHPEGVPMYIRAVMCRCAGDLYYSSSKPMDNASVAAAYFTSKLLKLFNRGSSFECKLV
jgi:hypothetical protein